MCCNVRLTQSSICIIGNSAERIKESAKSGTKVTTERTSYSRSFNYETYGKHFDYLGRGSKSKPQACKQVFGSR
jgi:hypothetical protein